MGEYQRSRYFLATLPFFLLSEAMWLSGFWIAVSLAFGGLVWYLAGPDGTVAYWTANLFEQNLWLNNVFTSFAVPREYRYHVFSTV